MHVLDYWEADDGSREEPAPPTTPPIPAPHPAAAQKPASKTFKPVQADATEPRIPVQGQPVPTIGWADNGAIALAAVPARVGTKECRYCGEEIHVNARKCKHCGEFLDQSARQQANQQTVTVVNQVVNDNRYLKWNPAVAALLSLFFPGLGQIYKGQLLNRVVAQDH
jgi:hypothetical protein